MLRSCDTMVALGNTTRSGQVLFAKNSDRPANECQPLVQYPRLQHASDAEARCQFLRLPQANVTYRHVGSRPYWCWGYEHGFNEHQVVIGNEGLPVRGEASPTPRLIGMEVLRLGLERGRSAAEAVEVMTALISRYGQGRFANAPAAGNYNNSYLVADPHEAYVIEAAGHQWAVKRVERTLGISNVCSIGTDWDRLSPEAEAYAQEQDWWDGQGRLNFAATYGEETQGNGARRRARSCAVLAQREGTIEATTMMTLLSDHSTGEQPEEVWQTRIHAPGGICVHYKEGAEEEGGNTAASLVADLCADGSRLPVYWCSFYSPCLGVFLPVFSEGELPPVLSVGDATPSAESPWWLFYRLSHVVRTQPEERVDLVRQEWAAFQARLLESAYPRAIEGRRLLDAGQADAASRLLTETMHANVAKMRNILTRMLARFQ